MSDEISWSIVQKWRNICCIRSDCAQPRHIFTIVPTNKDTSGKFKKNIINRRILLNRRILFLCIIYNYIYLTSCLTNSKDAYNMTMNLRPIYSQALPYELGYTLRRVSTSKINLIYSSFVPFKFNIQFVPLKPTTYRYANRMLSIKMHIAITVW